LERVLFGCAGAVLAGALAAVLDASWSANADTGVGSLLLPTLGLLVPIALLVGLLVSVGSWFLHPQAPPSLRGLKASLTRGDAAERGVTAWIVFWSGPLGFHWLWLSAKSSLAILQSGLEASGAGAAMAVAVVLAALVLVLAALGLAKWCCAHFSAADPGRMLLLAIGSALALFVLGVVVGETSGTGGPLAVFGVF
jgi:hypothetical protein